MSDIGGIFSSTFFLLVFINSRDNFQKTKSIVLLIRATECAHSVGPFFKNQKYLGEYKHIREILGKLQIPYELGGSFFEEQVWPFNYEVIYLPCKLLVLCD